MSDYITRYSAKDLLKILAQKELVEKEQEQEVVNFIAKHYKEKELPIYLQVFTFFGVFLASLCFIAFLHLFGIIDFDDRNNLILFGLIFIGIAFSLYLKVNYEHTVKESFYLKFSLVSMLIGKIMFALEFSAFMRDKSMGTLIGSIIITFITYPFYKVSIDRFLSSAACLLLLFININIRNVQIKQFENILFYMFFLSHLILVAFLFTYSKFKRDFIPLSYALIFSLCLTQIAHMFGTSTSLNKEIINVHQMFYNIGLMLWLVFLVHWVSKGFKNFNKEPLFIALGCIVLLGIISASNIMLAIGLMIIGYAKHENLLNIIGGFFLAVSLFGYYYSLELTLLQKSGVLLGSGILLWLVMLYMKFKGWDKVQNKTLNKNLDKGAKI